MSYKAVDFEGREFKVGDIFVSAQGRHSKKLSKYQVLSIEEDVDWRNQVVYGLKAQPFRLYDWESTKPVKITKLDSCCIIS